MLRLKKGLCLAVTVAMMSATLFGCGGQKNETTGITENESGEGKTYTIRIAANSERQRADNIIAACDRLTEQLKEEGSSDVVKGEYVMVETEFQNEMAMWDKTGNLPELVVANSFIIHDFADAGFLIPADDVINGEVYSEKLMPVFKDAVLIDGTYYGVPQDTDVRCVWINKQHLKKLGWTEEQIDALPQQVVDGQFTESDLQQLAKQAVDQGITEWGIIHRPVFGPEFDLMLMIHDGAGENLYRDGKVVLDQSALTDTLDFLKANVDMGLTPAELTTYGWDVVEGDLMPNGKTFCWYGGLWNKYDMMNAANVTSDFVDENFVLILPPVVNKGDTPITLSETQAYAMTKQAASDPKMQEYCERVLEIVLDPDIQMNTTVATAHPAITYETAEYPEYKADTFLSENTYMLDYTTTQVNEPVVRNQYMNTSWFSAIQKVEMETADVQTAVDELIDEVTYQVGEENCIVQD